MKGRECQNLDNDNYFDHTEEDVLHDAFLMIVHEDTDYENIEDVLINETIFDAESLKHWKNEGWP